MLLPQCGEQDREAIEGGHSLVSDRALMGMLTPILNERSDPSGKRIDLLRRECGSSEVELESAATE